MTAPRQIIPGTTYLVTRRCFQRELLLTPSPIVNSIFAYVLAVAAERYGVLVHAFCVLSNHYHLVVTDPRAKLPAFQQLLGALVARAVNAHLGRWESFWAPSSYSAVALASPVDVLDKAGYVLANPVAAGLVRSASSWPGLWSSPELIGGTMVLERPEHFFSKRGKLPKVIELELTPPPGFASADDYREQLEAELARREAAAQERTIPFLGTGRVLAQNPRSKPRSNAPRRELRPRVAARDKWRRLEWLARLKGFAAEYREALAAWREKKPCLFPAGTYLMRVVHGAPCACAA